MCRARAERGAYIFTRRRFSLYNSDIEQSVYLTRRGQVGNVTPTAQDDIRKLCRDISVPGTTTKVSEKLTAGIYFV